MTSPLYDLTSDGDASDVTPLAALIDEVRNLFADTHGVPLSYGDIARRSKGRLSRQRVQQLAKDPVKAMPSPEVILGLALGLAVPESVVLERALVSSGYYKPRGERREETHHDRPAKTEAGDTPPAAPTAIQYLTIEDDADQIAAALQARLDANKPPSTE